VPQQSELSLEEFAAGLSTQVESPASQELSVEDFAAGLKREPAQQPQTFPGALSSAYSRLGRAFAGPAMEALAPVAGVLGQAESFVGRGIQAVTGKKVPAKFPMQMAEEQLSQKGQELYPPEAREQANVPERAMSFLGGVAPAAVASAVGGPAAVFTFGAQTGLPLYYDTLKATGDKALAVGALLFGGTVGQLQHFGAAGAAGKVLNKLATGTLGNAVKNFALHTAVGGLEGAAAMGAQRAVIDAAHEQLTGEDLNNWDRIKEILPEALLGTAFFHAMDATLTEARHGEVPESWKQVETAGEPPSMDVRTAAKEAERARVQTQGIQRVGEVAAAEGTPEAVATTRSVAPSAAVEGTVPEVDTLRELKETARKTSSVQDRIQSEHQLHAKSIEELEALEQEIIADEKRLKKQLEEQGELGKEWERKAMMAVRAGDDTLAKEALRRKGEHDNQVAEFAKQWDLQKQAVDKLKDQLRTLNDKIEEAKRKKNILIARQKRAEAQKAIQDTMRGLSDNSAFDTFDRMSQKVDQLEAESEASVELGGELAGDTLQQKFKKLEASSGGGSDHALAELKAKMGLGPMPDAPQPALPSGTDDNKR
jgi:phage shock protein A